MTLVLVLLLDGCRGERDSQVTTGELRAQRQGCCGHRHLLLMASLLLEHAMRFGCVHIG